MRYSTTTTTCPPGTTTTAVPPTTTTTSTTLPPTTTTTVPMTTTTTSTPVPSGFAGISDGGENCGAGPTGHCDVPPLPVANVPVPALAFTGAPTGWETGIGMSAVIIGVILIRFARRLGHS